MVVRSTRTVWTIPIGLLIMALAAWAVFVPLVGPYFGFGFETGEAWSFTRLHWILSIAPGIVAFAGGLMMLLPSRAPTWLGSFLALLGGVWLLAGPSLYPLFSSGEIDPLPAPEGKTALLWIGYFYGVGALIVFLAGLAQGIASRRPAEVIRVEEPVVEPRAFESARSRTLVYP